MFATLSLSLSLSISVIVFIFFILKSDHFLKQFALTFSFLLLSSIISSTIYTWFFLVFHLHTPTINNVEDY